MILVLNGPNLNMLGLREPEVYGYETLDDIGEMCREAGEDLDQDVDFRQSNHEGELVTWIQEARGQARAIVINAGAYTHTSVALHDALRVFDGRIVELHISNPHQREPFRHLSYISPVADVVIAGFGTAGYVAAVTAAAQAG